MSVDDSDLQKEHAIQCRSGFPIVSDSGGAFTKQLGILVVAPAIPMYGFYSDRRIHPYIVLTGAIHTAGAKAMVQITHRWHSDFPYGSAGARGRRDCRPSTHTARRSPTDRS